MNKIKLLLLEDNEQDLTLLIFALKRAEYQVQYKNVITKDEFIAALEEDWDVIIADYTLPQFNGREALEILKESKKDFPFIIVSGTIGEEFAVSIMKAGANDYIMKNNMTRLVPAIEREILEAKNRKQKRITEQKLAESERRYFNMFENNNAPMLLIKNETQEIVEVNNAAAEFYGYTKEQFKTMKFSNLLVQDFDISIINEKFFSNSKLINKYYIHKLASGEQRNIEVFSSLLEFNNTPHTCIIIYDITERIEVQLNLAKTKNFIQSIHNVSPVGIITIDLEGKILEWNKRSEELTGYNYDSAIGNKLNNVFNKEAFWFDALKLSLIENSKIVDLEDKIINKNNELVSVSLSINPLEENDGSVNAYVIILSDITETKKNRNELEKILYALEQSSVGIVFMDLDGKIEYVNKKVCEETGFGCDELFGNSYSVLLANQSDKDKISSIWGMIRDGGEWKGELLSKRKNSSVYWDSISVSSVTDINGRIGNILVIKEDITIKKKQEEEVFEAKRKAEESNSFKSTILANLSHEFRTPLNGIMGLSDILLSDESNENTKQIASDIMGSATRLMAALTSMLDLAELQADKIQFKASNININEICYELINNYKQKAKEKGLKLFVHSLDNTLTCRLDQKLLLKILGQLLDNAIKFTHKGEVKITISPISKGNINYAKIEISDTGIGIPEEYQSVVFEEFKQISEGLSRKYEGNGIGLTIAKGLTEHMGGEISLVSNSSGTTVSVIFNVSDIVVQGSNEEVADKKIFTRSKAYNVLLVEDNYLNSEVVRWYIGAECVLDHVNSGEEAVKTITQKKYDAILMDINLGAGIDGVETAKLIRSMPSYKNIFIAALTGYALLNDESRLLEQGFDFYVPKPFSRIDLQNVIKKISEKYSY